MKKASDWWNVWFGFGKHNNQPIPGGINAMETDHKPSWRKSYDQAGNRTFSRWKNIIKCMTKEKNLLEKEDEFFKTLVKWFSSIVSFEKMLRDRKNTQDEATVV